MALIETDEQELDTESAEDAEVERPALTKTLRFKVKRETYAWLNAAAAGSEYRLELLQRDRLCRRAQLRAKARMVLLGAAVRAHRRLLEVLRSHRSRHDSMRVPAVCTVTQSGEESAAALAGQSGSEAQLGLGAHRKRRVSSAAVVTCAFAARHSGCSKPNGSMA